MSAVMRVVSAVMRVVSAARARSQVAGGESHSPRSRLPWVSRPHSLASLRLPLSDVASQLILDFETNSAL